jgi:hypothetical protein
MEDEVWINKLASAIDHMNAAINDLLEIDGLEDMVGELVELCEELELQLEELESLADSNRDIG